MSQTPERINKLLARYGLGSRRAMDELVAKGKVTVNGTVALLGQKVTENDTIIVNGTVITGDQPAYTILALNKPRGVTTTKQDPFAKVTIMHYVPEQYQHLFPVGRLDRESRGLILLTNNGDLALKLQHPRYEHEKEYDVTLKANATKTEADFTRDLTRLGKEIVLQDVQTKPPTVTDSSFNSKTKTGKATIVLKEGKKRQIRRLFAALGYDVTDLVRTRIGKITLDGLKEGEYREVDETLLH